MLAISFASLGLAGAASVAILCGTVTAVFAQTDHVTDCDRQAAHPADRDRVADHRHRRCSSMRT